MRFRDRSPDSPIVPSSLLIFLFFFCREDNDITCWSFLIEILFFYFFSFFSWFCFLSVFLFFVRSLGYKFKWIVLIACTHNNLTITTTLISNYMYYWHFYTIKFTKWVCFFQGEGIFFLCLFFCFFFLVLLWSGEKWSSSVCESKPPHSVIRLGWITVTCFSFFSWVFCCCVS